MAVSIMMPVLHMRKWKWEKLLVQGLTVRKMGAQTAISGPASTPVSFLSLCAPALRPAACEKYSTTKACHRTHLFFFVRTQKEPLGCETRELGREQRHLNLVGRSCRPWEQVTAKIRLECIMLPAWTARVSI